jgi:hypothetical protein
MKIFSKILATVAVLTCGFVSMQTASALPVNGTEQLGGTFTIGPNFLNFCVPASPGANCPAAPGGWNVPATGLGDLSTYNGGGIETNLSSGAEPVGTLLATPVLFLTFTGGSGNPAVPDIEFFITEVFAGVGTGNCVTGGAGSTCTPAGSPVTFLNTTGSTSSATISAIGFARRISTGEDSPLNMVFTSQFTTNYETVEFQESQQGFVTNTYSATFTASSIPEPSTMQMMGAGIGLVLFAVARRRKQTR